MSIDALRNMVYSIHESDGVSLMRILVCVLLAAVFVVCCRAADVRGRTWDALSDDAIAKGDASVSVLTARQRDEFGERQIPLCMIGDSITWAQEGDYWRKWLVKLVPEVAFVGTHTGRLGFSHAGEGGNSTVGVLKRIDDRSRIPDCPYYHLMIGINDCSAARTEAEVPGVASNTVRRIWRIVDGLLARPTTRKVFLASILPVRVPTRPCRDAAGSAANVLMRAEIARRYPEGRVVWVEYERPLREDLGKWLGTGDTFIHPRAPGYATLAEIFAPILRRERCVPAKEPKGTYGVEVENLWREDAAATRPLVPGWYVCSFAAPSGTVNVRLRNRTANPKGVFDKTFTVEVADGRRGEFEFMTGYQGYGYDMSPFVFEATDAGGRALTVKDVQFEKMRPSRRASCFGRGVFVDMTSPACAGELLVEKRRK